MLLRSNSRLAFGLQTTRPKPSVELSPDGAGQVGEFVVLEGWIVHRDGDARAGVVEAIEHLGRAWRFALSVSARDDEAWNRQRLTPVPADEGAVGPHLNAAACRVVALPPATAMRVMSVTS